LGAHESVVDTVQASRRRKRATFCGPIGSHNCRQVAHHRMQRRSEYRRR
jgi:hypothetical protein